MLEGKISNESRRWIFYAGVLVALLPLMVCRDFTPDNELRYLSITDEALRNHDIFAFHNHGLPYADKPPLYFWLLMLCRVLAGKHCMWLLALCSLLPAFGVVAVMDKWSANRSESRMMLMTAAYFLGASVILRMDMLMCLFIVLSLYTFWKIYIGKAKPRDRWLFPIYLFLALFTKGPLGILIPLFATLIFLLIKGQARDIAKYWGWRTWAVLLGLCVLWFSGVYADGGKEYLDNLLFHQTIDRAVDSFHHKRPFFYYLIAMWYIIAPWSLYVIGAIVADLRHPSRLTGLQQFFITTSVTTLLLLSCISSKLQIYFLPAIPFMVYAAMMSMPKYKDCPLTKIAIGFPAAVFAVILPVYLVAILLGLEFKTPELILALLLTAGGTASGICLLKKGVYKAITGIGVTMLAAIFAAGVALPGYNDTLGYGELCKEAIRISETEKIGKIYTWKIKRPENMDVYLGKDVIIIDNDSIPGNMHLGRSIILSRHDKWKAEEGENVHQVGPYVIIVNK